ncbi:MAG: hypothetical protein U0637_15350 [Phycisphaerales bacterium]
MRCARTIAVTLSLITGGAALGHNSYLGAFTARYPASTLPARMLSATGSSCNVCHHPASTSSAGNCYKVALAARINAGRSIAQALGDVALLDSDNDGVSNEAEILQVRADLPGQVGYSPGLAGVAGSDPCGAAGAVTNQPETPPPAGPVCDSIDFNGDGLFPDAQDIGDYLLVFGGGGCPTGTCGDIDFNNDGLFPDTSDLASLLQVFGGGACE